MALTYIAAATGSAASSTVDASSLNVAAGDVLVAVISNEPEGYSCTVTDSDGSSNAYTVLAEQNSGNGYCTRLAYRLVATADSTHVARSTLSGSPYGNHNIIVFQFRPDSGETVTLDTGPSSGGSTWGTAVATASFTTAGTDEVVVVGVSRSTGTLSSLQIGGTAVDGSVGSSMLAAGYRILTATASGITGSATLSTNMSWSAQALSIRSAATGIVCAGIPSTEALGRTRIQWPINFELQAYTRPSLTAINFEFGDVTGIVCTGIPSSEAFGSASISAGISATSIASAEAFGQPTISAVHSIDCTGIPSAEAFGTPAVQAGIQAAGIASAEAIGSPAIAATVAPAGIVSGEAFGNPALAAIIAGTGISSAEAFGLPTIGTEAGIVAIGIPSAEAFGAPGVSATIAPSGIASAETFGAPSLQVTISAAGITSAESFGAPALSAGVTATGIASAQAFGTPSIAAGIMAASIASVEAIGQPSIGVSLFLAGIASAEAFGNPTLYTGGMGEVIVSGAWKKAIEAKVLIGGIWRDIDKPYAIIGGEWVELS